MPDRSDCADDTDGDGRLTFVRVRELHSEGRFTPYGSHRMLLEQPWVSSVLSHGGIDW